MVRVVARLCIMKMRLVRQAHVRERCLGRDHVQGVDLVTQHTMECMATRNLLQEEIALLTPAKTRVS